MFRIGDVTCDYQHNPLGVGEACPQFGWKLESEKRGVLQTTYRLQLAKNDLFMDLSYDSGEVTGAQSAHVVCEGFTPRPATRYYVRVRACSNSGEDSGWSATAWFETAADPAWWEQASFISGEAAGDGEKSEGRLLRHSFTLREGIVSARAYTSALGLYEFYLNGARVGEGVLAPGWTSYHKRLQYQSHDVTSLVRPGPNAAAAMTGAGWYKGTMGFVGLRNNYGDRAAFIGLIRVCYADGSSEIIATGPQWQCNRAPVTYAEIYHGECYDARLELPGFATPEYDAAGWFPVGVVEYPRAALVPQDGLDVVRVQELPAQRMFVTPKGEWVLDFGQNLTGWVRFKARGRAGERVTLRHAEILDHDGNFYTENLRTARSRIEYTLRGEGEEVYEPHFTYHGFRYVQVVEYPGALHPEDFTAVVLHSAMEPTGAFSCSNPLLNQLQHNILWGLKGNFLDVPTDCPQRDERLGWTGDAEIFIRTACFLMNTYPFFRKWLRDLAADQLADGGVPHVVPDVLKNALSKNDGSAIDMSGDSAAAWGDAAVICPWTLYLCYGDTQILRGQYASMKAWVERVRRAARGETIWDTGFQFGDWVALDAKEGSYFGATPNDLVATAYYANSVDILAKTAAILQEKEDAAQYRDLHGRIVHDFGEEFFTPTGRLAARTQTACILSLCFGLVPGAHRGRTVKTLLELLAEQDGHLVTGFVGTPYFCRALSENGRLQEAYALLLQEDYPSWLYQVKRGATTVWEHWDGLKPDGTMWSPDMNSFNHYAYGAVGDWLYRVVAGLDTDEAAPGYQRTVFCPHPGGGLDWAQAFCNPAYGEHFIRWERQGEEIALTLRVPANTTALLRLDGAREAACEEGLAFEEAEGGLRADLGSGEYHVRYTLQ